MKPIVAWIVVTACVINMWLFWGTPAIYGWTVALAGWIGWCFSGERDHGQS